MVELTGLERIVVLINRVLLRKPLLLTNRKLQLRRQHRLLLMQLQVRLPVCRHILLNSGILQRNIQVKHQVRTIIPSGQYKLP